MRDEQPHKPHKLVPSSTSGRYAIDTPGGPDLTSGQPIRILLGGQWITGRVEYGYNLYVTPGPQYLGDVPTMPETIDGYYFVYGGNQVCGLMVGMLVERL
jgi:hypothetical protein